MASVGASRMCPITGCGWATANIGSNGVPHRSWYREHLAQHSDDGKTRRMHKHPSEVKQ